MNKIFKLSTLLMLLLGVTGMLQAKKIVLPAPEMQMVEGFSVTIEDTEATEAIIAAKKVSYTDLNARFYLSFDHNTTLFVEGEQALDQTVDLIVTPSRYDVATAAWVDGAVENVQLTINYSTSTFEDVVYKQVSLMNAGVNYTKFTVEVASISNAEFASAFKLSAEMVAKKRFIEFDFLAINDLLVDGTPYLTRNEVEVSWEPIMGAEEYELEWTYVNKIDENEGVYTAATAPFSKGYFDNNATRVTILGTTYNVPVLYEEGFVVFRIRAIGLHLTNHQLFVYGKWTTANYESDEIKVLKDYTKGGSTDGLAQNYFDIQKGHQQQMNWQSTVNFAEEGKNKVAISYFDGSLRNRQVVSRINTEVETIVGETVYDFEGRPAVQILPVPTGKEIIEYNTNFNRNTDDKKFTANDFDVAPAVPLEDADECVVLPKRLSTTSGAGQYYSPEIVSPKGEEHDNYVPNAKGYPYTQIEYTSDNTGRIARQSGVGEDHVLESGHETKYFYITPDPEEITRLFGNEVGENVHYKKNMVQDANGQVSVSYLDAQGRTIATALAGNNPEALDPIFTAEDEVESEHTNMSRGRKLPFALADGDVATERLINDDKGLEFTKHIGVESDGSNREFTYDITAPNYEINCDFLDEQNLDVLANDDQCYGCVLDVSIMLLNKCGKPLVELNETLNQDLLDAIEAGTLEGSETCGSEDAITGSTFEALDLMVGAYTVSKVIKINDAALDYYEALYLASPCVAGFDKVLDETRIEMDLTFNCNFDCSKCAEEIGDYNINYNPITNEDCDPCFTYDEYVDLINECEAACNGTNECDSYFTVMVENMAPNGQYGLAFTDEGSFEETFEDERYNLSIYNESNNMILEDADWRHPMLHDYPERVNIAWSKIDESDKGNYFNGDGSIAFIEAIFVPTPDGSEGGSLVPAIHADYLELYQDDITELEENGVTARLNVKPQHLLKVQDFLTLFDAEYWAHSLLIYHPEYPNLSYCFSTPNYYSFRETLTQFADLDALDDALHEIDDDVTIGDLIEEPWEVDPYVSNNTFTEFYLKRRYENYKGGLSAFKLAYITVVCPGTYNTSGGTDFCEDPEADCSSVLEGITTREEKESLIRGTYTVGGDLVITPEQGLEMLRILLTLYSGTRDDRYDQRYSQYAIMNDSYNGCFDNENFTFNDYAFRKYRFFLDRELTFTTWGNRWRNSVGYPINVSAYRFPLSQAFSPNQPCSILNKRDYKDKTAVMAHTGNFFTKGGLFDGGCSSTEIFLDPPPEGPFDMEGINTLVYDESVLTGTDPAPCLEKDFRLIESMEKRANIGYIDNCGQCPVSFTTATFLSELLSRGYLNTNVSDKVINCNPDFMETYFASFKKSWEFNNQVEQQISLTVSDGTTTQDEDGTFIREKIVRLDGANTDEFITFHLFLFEKAKVLSFADESKNGEKIDVDVDWSLLSGFCCMSFLEDSERKILTPIQYSSVADGKTFSLGANFIEPDLRNEFVRLEGYVEQQHTDGKDGVLFNECELTSCESSSLAVSLMEFLSEGLAEHEAIEIPANGVPIETTVNGLLLAQTRTDLPDFQAVALGDDLVKEFDPAFENYSIVSFADYDFDIISFADEMDKTRLPFDIIINTTVGDDNTFVEASKRFELIDPDGENIDLSKIREFVYMGPVDDDDDYVAARTVKVLARLNTDEDPTTYFNEVKTYYLTSPFDLYECTTKDYRSNIE